MSRGMTYDESKRYSDIKKKKYGRFIFLIACIFIFALGALTYILCANQKQELLLNQKLSQHEVEVFKVNIALQEAFAGIYFAISISGFVTIICRVSAIKKFSPDKLMLVSAVLIAVLSGVTFALQIFCVEIFASTIANYLVLGILSGFVSFMFNNVSVALDNEDRMIRKKHIEDRNERR